MEHTRYVTTTVNLAISKITVDEGPKLKRFRPRAKGSAYPIQKKVSHITLVLDELKGQQPARALRKETEAAESVTPVRSSTARRPSQTDKARLERPQGTEQSVPRPKTERGIQRFFRRKAI